MTEKIRISIDFIVALWKMLIVDWWSDDCRWDIDCRSGDCLANIDYWSVTDQIVILGHILIPDKIFIKYWVIRYWFLIRYRSDIDSWSGIDQILSPYQISIRSWFWIRYTSDIDCSSGISYIYICILEVLNWSCNSILLKLNNCVAIEPPYRYLDICITCFPDLSSLLTDVSRNPTCLLTWSGLFRWWRWWSRWSAR